MQPQFQMHTQPNGVDIVVVLVAIALGLFFTLAISFVVSLLVYLPYKKLPAEHQKMPPGQVFLLMIPLFNLVWNFFVFLKVPESFQSFYVSRGRPEVGDAGRTIGMWFAICAACSVVPCLNYLAGPAALVLLIIFLVKVWQLSGPVPQMIAQPPAEPRSAPPTAPPPPPPAI